MNAIIYITLRQKAEWAATNCMHGNEDDDTATASAVDDDDDDAVSPYQMHCDDIRDKLYVCLLDIALTIKWCIAQSSQTK